MEPNKRHSRNTIFDTTSAVEDENDVLIAEVLGDSSCSSADQRSFNRQLKLLDGEPRQSSKMDVCKYWVDKKQTHPEISSVASVVLATPSNQVSVERAFSALGLVLTDLRSTLSEDTLSNILLIKLNKALFENEMSDFRDN